MRRQPLYFGFWHALGTQFGLGLLTRLALHQRLGLRQAVGEQPLVMVGQRVVAVDRDDEVRRYQQTALVQQLVVGMLTVAADATPDDRPCGNVQFATVLAHALAVGLHVQLLQVLGEVTQVVVVWQDGVALRAPEIGVPDTQQGHQHRHVLGQWRLGEVLVHGVGTGQQLLEVGYADGQGDGQTDGRPQRVTPANPVPHGEDVLFADTELDGGLAVAGHGDEVAMQLLFRAAHGQVPVARGQGVLQGFQGAEGLAGNDEQRGFRIEAGSQFAKLAAVDIGQVMTAHTALRERTQCFGNQLRAEEGAANADVDHFLDRLFAVAAPQTAVNATDQFGDLVQDAMDLGDDVMAVDQQAATNRATQSRVQCGAAFRSIDLLTVEQVGDGLLQTGLLGQLNQQFEAALIDQVFRVIQQQPAAVERKSLVAPCIRCKGLAHAEPGHLGTMLLQGLPGGQGGDVMRLLVIGHRSS